MKFLALTFITLITSSLAQPVPAGGNTRQAQGALKKADTAHPAKFRISSKREGTQAFKLSFGKRQETSDPPVREGPGTFKMTFHKRDRSRIFGKSSVLVNQINSTVCVLGGAH